MKDIFEAIVNLKSDGKPSVLAIIVKAGGSTHRRIGGKDVASQLHVKDRTG